LSEGEGGEICEGRRGEGESLSIGKGQHESREKKKREKMKSLQERGY